MIEYSFDKGYREDVKQMWAEIFQDPENFMDFYFSQVCEGNLIFTARDGRKLVGMIHLNPYIIMNNGFKEKTYYIVGVCVEKEYRFKGIMKEMLHGCLEYMKEEQVSFTFLMPKDEGYYKGMGFQNIYSNLEIKYNNIVCYCKEDGFTLKDISDYSDEELDAFGSRLNTLIKDEYNVFSVRDVIYLKRLINEHKCQNGSVMEVFFKGKSIGYFSFDVYEALDGASNNMFVERFFAADGYVPQTLELIKAKAIEKNCATVNVTVSYNKASDVEWKANIIEKEKGNIKIFKGKGVMAYCFDGAQALENMKKNSFFDEIV